MARVWRDNQRALFGRRFHQPKWNAQYFQLQLAACEIQNRLKEGIDDATFSVHSAGDSGYGLAAAACGTG
jgi:predicted kinase